MAVRAAAGWNPAPITTASAPVTCASSSFTDPVLVERKAGAADRSPNNNRVIDRVLAITRAQQLVVLVGSRRALQMAVDNADQQHRESALAARLERAGSGSGTSDAR